MKTEAHDIYECGIFALKEQKFQEVLESFSFCYDNIKRFNIYHRPLILHLLGLLYFSSGNLDLGEKYLYDAMKAEKECGHEKAARHTNHQTSLLKHVDGDVRRTEEYYITTFKNLKKIRQFEGMAFCLKSLGEILLFRGEFVQAEKLFLGSYKLLKKVNLREKETLQYWISLVDSAINVTTRIEVQK